MSFRVAIVGATGAVGEELLQVMEEREFPVGELGAFASERSMGRSVVFRGESIPVRLLKPEDVARYEVVYLSAGATVSVALRPHLKKAGCYVYDNTSAFRMHPEVPLVVPEVNGAQMTSDQRWIAVPNCTAILLVLALHPLHQAFGLKRAVVATYQSVSGAGRKALLRLMEETARELNGEPEPVGQEQPFAFNVLPSIGGVASDDELMSGATGEERKVLQESRRILGHPNLSMAVTCVRVPVRRAHSEAVVVELDARPTLEQVAAVLSQAPGVTMRDRLSEGIYPTPREASGGDGILLGRLRRADQPNAFAFFLSGDQLRKGAALNAVQIAEMQLRTQARARHGAA